MLKVIPRIFCITICIALLLQVQLAAAKPYTTWLELTIAQQDALQPLAIQWNSLPDKLQVHLLHAANQYQKLTPEQKLRFQSRLEKWSKLTQEQRERARNKFMFTRNAPPEQREQLKRKVYGHEISMSNASSVQASMTVR